MSLKLMTGIVITICYLIITTSFSVLDGIGILLEKWGQTQELNIYLKHIPTDQEKQEIEKILSKYNTHLKYEYVDSEKLLRNIKSQLPALSHELDKDKELVHLLPAHFVVNAENHIIEVSKNDLFSEIMDKLKSLNIIMDMNYGQAWLERYSHFLTSVKGGSLLIFLGLCFALVLVVSNSIRSTIDSKKEEIEILELVGATQKMIRKPFLIEGTITSLVCMCLALLLTSLFTLIIKNISGSQYSLFGVQLVFQYLNLFEVIFFLTTSAVLGYLGSYWVIKSYNNGWSSIQN